MASGSSANRANIISPSVKTGSAGKSASQGWLLDRTSSIQSAVDQLLGLLDEWRDLGLSWTCKKVLLIQMPAEDTVLDVIGIDQDGSIEIPWFIGDYKQKFRTFAETLAAAIPGAIAYETPKMWRVRKDGRNVQLAELLEASSGLRTAFEVLRAALAT
jgi:hypothetical protein